MNTYFALLLICYIFILAALVRLKNGHFRGKNSHLLRSFLPSWKFFEDYDEQLILFYRIRQGDLAFGEWEHCLEQPERNLSSVLLNPTGNRLLACQSAIQRLVFDIQNYNDKNTQELENSFSYRLIKSLVCYQLNQIAQKSGDRLHYQFKIGSPNEDFLVSGVYAVPLAGAAER